MEPGHGSSFPCGRLYTPTAGSSDEPLPGPNRARTLRSTTRQRSRHRASEFKARRAIDNKRGIDYGASRRAGPVVFGARFIARPRDAGVGSHVACSAISSGAVDDVHTCAVRAFPNLADRRVVASVPVQRRLHRRNSSRTVRPAGASPSRTSTSPPRTTYRPPAARLVSAARLCGWCCLFGSKPSCADPSPPVLLRTKAGGA